MRKPDADVASESPHVPEPKVHRLLGLEISRRSLSWTVGASLVAAVALGTALAPSDPSPAPTAPASSETRTNSGVSIEGNNNTNNGNTTYNSYVQQYLQEIPDAANEKAVREAAAKYATVSPSGAGPWPFVSIANRDLGLKVRSTPYMDGVQIGSIATGAPAWAICRLSTGFNPQPGDPNGDTWFKIKWPRNAQTKEFDNSSPSDEFYGWVYGGLIVPLGHSGGIPTCGI